MNFFVIVIEESKVFFERIGDDGSIVLTPFAGRAVTIGNEIVAYERSAYLKRVTGLAFAALKVERVQ